MFSALENVNDQNFNNLIYIRNQGHTITEAILRQLGHCSYHVGEIVFLGKLIKRNDWKNITSPKGKFKAYNIENFAKDKTKEHFAKEFTTNSGE